jgi:hypothetical protein
MELENLSNDELLQYEGGLIWFIAAGLCAIAASCVSGSQNSQQTVIGNGNILINGPDADSATIKKVDSVTTRIIWHK